MYVPGNPLAKSTDANFAAMSFDCEPAPGSSHFCSAHFCAAQLT